MMVLCVALQAATNATLSDVDASLRQSVRDVTQRGERLNGTRAGWCAAVVHALLLRC